MFNIILIISGLLEYILLGIDFHVIFPSTLLRWQILTLRPAG
jgi:hypothetical protein